MARLMSDAEIKHRKKIQGHLSQATGTLGLTALGGTLLGTKAGGRVGAKALKLVRSKKTFPSAQKFKDVTAPVLATSAGIGGAGSFNFASYTNAESRKRKQMAPVSKAYTLEFPHFDSEGISKRYEDDLSKATKLYDPESKRQRRNEHYADAAVGGAGVAAVGSAHQAYRAGGHYRSMDLHEGNPTKTARAANFARKAAKKKFSNVSVASPTTSAKTGQAKKAGTVTGKAKVRGFLKTGRRSAALAGVAGAGLYGAHKIREKNRGGSWTPYT